MQSYLLDVLSDVIDLLRAKSVELDGLGLGHDCKRPQSGEWTGHKGSFSTASAAQHSRGCLLRCLLISDFMAPTISLGGQGQHRDTHNLKSGPSSFLRWWALLPSLLATTELISYKLQHDLLITCLTAPRWHELSLRRAFETLEIDFLQTTLSPLETRCLSICHSYLSSNASLGASEYLMDTQQPCWAMQTKKLDCTFWLAFHEALV